jgi:RNA polymerase sigma-54 factor
MLLQRHVTSTRPMTTAHLAQTMTLLGLTAVELRQKIEAELSSNPALELVEERRCPHCRRLLPGGMQCPVCSQPKNLQPDQPIVFVSPREDFYSYTGARSEQVSDDAYALSPMEEDLSQYVLRQVAPELKVTDRPIAAHILTSLNEDGLLAVPPVEIARFHHVPLSHVQQVLYLIQRADPIGVGSPTPKEALLVQLEVLSETRHVPELAAQAIEKGMNLLSRRRYQELGAILGINTSRAREIARFIGDNLHPFPGRTHWGESNLPSNNSENRKEVYYCPDIIISKQSDSENSPLIVEIAMPIWGTLRVNPLFKEALQEAPPEKAEHWRADIDRAVLLVKCLQQRNHTIVRLMEQLTVLQRKYILLGSAHLLPITRAYISKELNVHESTVSRAVSGKAVQLPNGHIVSLATFFDRSLHIRTALKRIIEKESHPLSDTEIGELLASQGHCVARRTVAKYRSMEGILPAHLRNTVTLSRP